MDHEELALLYRRCQVAIADSGQLATSLAHDLGNELAILKLNAQLLLRHPDMTDAMRGHAAALDEHAGAASVVLSEIVGMARGEPARSAPTDLVRLLVGLLPVLRRLLPANISVEPTWPSEPCTVIADAGRLREVVLHLVRNAADAMPHGGVVSLRCAAVHTPQDGVRITVADTGAGMDETVRARAFEPFFSTKPPDAGAGLGLPTVRRLVTEHGGTVELHSVLHQGTRIEIWLPA